jgi:hypothetical protein
MSFAQTAAYFAGRAARAHSDDDRERFVETSHFYQSLARITMDFPPGYAPPETWHADRFKARAEECRAIAEHLSDPQCSEQMMDVAQSYDLLAHAAE